MASSTSVQGAEAITSDNITPRAQPDPRLAAVLRRLREERKISQEKLAHEAGLTTSGYVRIEGANVAAAWSNVRRIAAALGITMEELGRLVEAEERG